MLGRTRQKADYRILHGIGGALPVTGDETDRCDDLRVLVRDEVLEVQLDLYRRFDTHIGTTLRGGREVDNWVMESGYSATPQLRKLGFREASRWDVVGAPSQWSFEVDPDAAGRTETGPVDLLLTFTPSARHLDESIESLAERIRPAGAIWILWPRKAAGHLSDMTENYIREVVLPRGLVDVKVAAVDADWSGLKVVWRLENR